MTKLKYINKTKSLNKFDNFILSAFNLAFIGYFYKKKIKSNKNLIVWPDGIFALKYGCKQKIPGRKIIKTLDKINDIKKIVVLGNCTNKELNFLNHNQPQSFVFLCTDLLLQLDLLRKYFLLIVN